MKVNNNVVDSGLYALAENKKVVHYDIFFFYKSLSYDQVVD